MPGHSLPASRSALLHDALVAYWKSLAIADPLRVEAWDDAGVTLPLLRVLVHLREHPGATTGDIARAMSVTSSNVTRLVDRLTQQGLVLREEHPEDRRSLRHTLTPEGERILGDARQRATAHVRSIFEQLDDDDLALLTDAFERLSGAARRARVAARDGQPAEVGA
jgi:DNA-binding MarR family transcriptional regulator